MLNETPITKEAMLCDVFMRAINKLNGWTCYPEAAEFDILAVHDYGRQISVEVKLKLYAKVVEQILPQEHDAQLPEGSCGCRMV